MRAFSFIHAADLHLDSPFKGLSGLPDAVKAGLRDSTFAALDRLVELALERRVDFVLFAGDIYDAKDRSLRAQLRFQQALQTLAGRGIRSYIIHGNHDPMQEGYAAKLSYPSEAHIFGCLEVESVVAAGADGTALARISGISFDRAAVTDNLTPGYVSHFDGLFHIGLLHTNVDGDGEHGNYAPCRLGDLLGRGIDYWALGHVHTRRVLHERPWVVYPGNAQGRHIREQGARGCYLVEVSAQGEAQLRFQPLDSWRWEAAEVPIDGLETEQQLKEALEEALDAAAAAGEGRSVLLRLSLTGRGVLHGVLRRAGAAQELASALGEACDGVWLESLTDRTGAQVDTEALSAQSGFLGELLRLAGSTGASSSLLTELCTDSLAPLSVNPLLASLLDGITEAEKREWLRQAEELAIDLLMPGLEAGRHG
ncbi:DNA repair exonuclease SbcCD nuclease subunit [Paenibacillus sp. UNCCL117]|uniref:metallophosphoesterase family protein n=1 Tax=unclassified Paenibacillus TaxID=185978 RepID=UPI00088AEDDB|nr:MULTISPECIES: DNA repair exonuclease [unclassified Paenibacillus]SDC24662.1 DNA repair exonuclease SbcCD nuclease subunit [Paenibacillus sp. cl123]SFW19622.1 DNA repair exonuclease SbcCD nuclease subunit [Paenibacillus sp. UNCCL117]